MEIIISLLGWIIGGIFGLFKSLFKKMNTLNLQDLNIIDRDETANILRRVRTEALYSPSLYFDIFETDGQNLVFTNFGMAYSDNVQDPMLIAYHAIKSISEPKPMVIKGKESKEWRAFTVEIIGGHSCDISYYNMAGGAVLGMLDNIRKTGYPLPEYTGPRRLTVADDEPAEEMIEESNNSIYEGH